MANATAVKYSNYANFIRNIIVKLLVQVLIKIALLAKQTSFTD